jgi:hypothetical protein
VLVALTGDKEMIAMIERFIEEEGLLMNMPFLQKIRAQSRSEAQRRAVLDVIAWRFNPPVLAYQQLEQDFASLSESELSGALLKTAAQAQTFEEFQRTLHDILTNHTTVEVA